MAPAFLGSSSSGGTGSDIRNSSSSDQSAISANAALGSDVLTLVHVPISSSSDNDEPLRPPVLTPDTDADADTHDDNKKGSWRTEDDDGAGSNIELHQLRRLDTRNASNAGSNFSSNSHTPTVLRHRSWSDASSTSSRSSSPADGLSYTPEEEAAVVRKFDRRLVLFVALLYMLSFLDRSNIGNARVAGMDDDLQTTPPRSDWYEWALTSFYISYITFEWLALLWRLLPAHTFVTVLVAGWGFAASLQAVTSSYPWLVILRAVLGIGEAGFAGIPLYLARFFRRDEMALRTAIFIAAAPLATTFAASLAWAILALGRHVASPIAPWRLLFLVEGFPSIVAAVIAYRVLPDAPGKAKYLTRREKLIAQQRLLDAGEQEDDDADDDDVDVEDGKKRDGDDDSSEDGDRDQREKPLRNWRLKLAFVAESSAMASAGKAITVLKDPVAWITAVMFFLANMAYSSLPVFLPTILTDMGHDAVAAQALSAPPYLAAFVIVLATAHLSDRMRARAPLLIFHALSSFAGYSVLSVSARFLDRTSILRYLAVYPAAIGFFNVVVLLITWNLNNQQGARRQGGAFALFQVVGQCGPLVGTRLYPDRDAPLYLPGMRTMAAAMLGVAILAVVLRAMLKRRNRALEILDAKAEAATAAAASDATLNDHNDDEEDSYGSSGGYREEEQQGLFGGLLRGRGRRNRQFHRNQEPPLFRYML